MVCELVRQVCNLARTFAGTRGATLAFSPSPGSLIAHVDGPKLHQIVRNLVRSALEAVPAGGHVEVTVSRDDESVTVRVEDDGPGIPEDVRDEIFEPFVSIHESGLSLSIAHHLVSLHAGRIDLTTSPEGTAFTVRLPQGN